MMTSESRSLSTLTAADFDAIEQAVMETARGRWFLREFAARNRHADTSVLLQAIGRLESAVSGERALEQIDRVRFDLLEMAKSIAGLKHELDSAEHGEAGQTRFGDATNALDGIVRTTESATSSILGAAEQVQEIAWSLREQQFDEAVCDRIDKLATEIYTACSFQDVTAQRTQKVVQTLRFLEGRINALVDAWATPGAADDSSPSAPPAEDAGLDQHDIDIVVVEDEPEAMPSRPPRAPVLAEPVSEPEPEAAAVMGAYDWAPAEPVSVEHEDLMATDDQQVVIDDTELLEVDFVDNEGDAHPDLTVKAPPRRTSAMPTLAEIDAMPATTKALIFG